MRCQIGLDELDNRKASGGFLLTNFSDMLVLYHSSDYMLALFNLFMLGDLIKNEFVKYLKESC